jgi:NADPH:quinone reductase-like Zn-dependent oxidoreductase
MGYEAAGIVDELGDGVDDVRIGDRVFGASDDGAAQAELAVLSAYAPIPPSLDFAGAAALPAAVETATRSLDRLGVANGSTLLINGASGVVGGAAVQLAVARGARVIGTAGTANQDYVRSLGAEPVAYGEGLVARVRVLAPDGVDLALDVAGSGVLPDLIELAGTNWNVVTVADFAGAKQYGVHFSRGDDGRALRALSEIGELIESGRFSLPVAQTFLLDEVAEAHRVGEGGHVRGKLVLLVD